QVGVVCGNSSQPLTGLLFYNNTGGDTVNCAAPTFSKSGNPLFSTSQPYQLTAASPCTDAAGSSCPPDDIYGDPRPIGSACDCGADEYNPN
ncbi:MAG: choice-of-anchor Q domain-containing protein, partial [Polyangia bacterium]